MKEASNLDNIYNHNPCHGDKTKLKLNDFGLT